MPNGGPDNCGTCGFNRQNGGMWRNPAPDKSQPPFCEIRSASVPFDLVTYCENWHTRTREPIGPIYSQGLHEINFEEQHVSGYVRIPWHGNVEPVFVHGGVCTVCQKSFSEGIEMMTVEGAPRQFCSNLHYLEWWRSQHPDEDAPMSASIGRR
jgi:hypothetical protein